MTDVQLDTETISNEEVDTITSGNVNGDNIPETVSPPPLSSSTNGIPRASTDNAGIPSESRDARDAKIHILPTITSTGVRATDAPRDQSGKIQYVEEESTIDQNSNTQETSKGSYQTNQLPHQKIHSFTKRLKPIHWILAILIVFVTIFFVLKYTTTPPCRISFQQVHSVQSFLPAYDITT